MSAGACIICSLNVPFKQSSQHYGPKITFSIFTKSLSELIILRTYRHSSVDSTLVKFATKDFPHAKLANGNSVKCDNIVETSNAYFLSSIKPFFFIQTLLIILLISSCAGTKTFNNRGIQKRKYTKGWFINKSFHPRSIGVTKKNDSPGKEILSVRKNKAEESDIHVEKINRQPLLVREDSLIEQVAINDTEKDEKISSHISSLTKKKENFLSPTSHSKAEGIAQKGNRKGEIISSDRHRARLNFIGFLVCFTIGLTCLILFFALFNSSSPFVIYFIIVAMTAGLAALGFGIRALLFM